AAHIERRGGPRGLRTARALEGVRDGTRVGLGDLGQRVPGSGVDDAHGRARPDSVPRAHQRSDREPFLRHAGLLTLVEVPALLPGEAEARERGPRGVLELHVDHHDGRAEGHLVRVLDGARGLEGFPAETPVVYPDLPELSGAVVDVGVRDQPGFLVDEDGALAVGVLGELGDTLDHVYAPLLPYVVERPVDLVVPLHREVTAVEDADQVALPEELPAHPGDVARVATVAVDVGILPEERVGALCGGEPAHAAEGREVEPRVVLLARVE